MDSPLHEASLGHSTARGASGRHTYSIGHQAAHPPTLFHSYADARPGTDFYT
ncbi:MAG: hypothetical protein U9Q78_07855 [Chloroflexota bacterium]|nr:hypothetical protein [Chloroflexota bacterium]